MNWKRPLRILAVALAVLALIPLFGCANTPVERSTDTPGYQLREGQTITIQIKPGREIADYARKNLDTAYRVDAVAFAGGDHCIVWMKPGWVDLFLLNHELAHCAGLRHDRWGKWQ